MALSPTLPHPTLTMWLGHRLHSRKSALENPPSSPTPATLGTSRQHSHRGYPEAMEGPLQKVPSVCLSQGGG